MLFVPCCIRTGVGAGVQQRAGQRGVRQPVRVVDWPVHAIGCELVASQYGPGDDVGEKVGHVVGELDQLGQHAEHIGEFKRPRRLPPKGVDAVQRRGVSLAWLGEPVVEPGVQHVGAADGERGSFGPDVVPAAGSDVK